MCCKWTHRKTVLSRETHTRTHTCEHPPSLTQLHAGFPLAPADMGKEAYKQVSGTLECASVRVCNQPGNDEPGTRLAISCMCVFPVLAFIHASLLLPCTFTLLHFLPHPALTQHTSLKMSLRAFNRALTEQLSCPPPPQNFWRWANAVNQDYNLDLLSFFDHKFWLKVSAPLSRLGHQRNSWTRLV